MASGLKRMIINPRERATSDDLDRLQAFGVAGQMEAFRYLFNVSRGPSGSLTNEHIAQEGPARAEIFAGLQVRPQAGSATFLVDPGLVCMIDPDGATPTNPTGTNSPDDSVYKLVRSVGVTSPASSSLAMATNSTGAPRIDVVECSRNPDVVIESETVNQFDPSTGLFAPTPLTKVAADDLTFRVRQGVPRAGFPGVVQGWLPLAVVQVPVGASSLDACTLWDVRPLISDRPTLTDRPVAYPRRTSARLYAYPGTTSGSLLLRGEHDAQLNDRTVGGAFADLALTDAANQSAGFNGYAQLAHVFVCTPFGLPRWAEYTGTVPGALLGIPVVTSVAPAPEGAPSSPVPLPTATGLGGSAQAMEGAHVASFAYLGQGFASSNAGQQNNAPIAVPLTDSNAPATAAFLLTPGVHFPANASRVLVQFTLGVESNSNTGGAGGVQTYAYAQDITVFRPGLTGTETNAAFYEEPAGGLSALASVTQHMDDGQSFYFSAFTKWIDIPPPPVGTPQGAVRVVWNVAYAAVTGTNGLSSDEHVPPFAAAVVGWGTR